MISIVCVYNNEKTLKNVLLKSLANQTADFELITLDNRRNRFKSAAEALNYGGKKAKGDYIMFAHQDMWLDDDSWIEENEKTLKTLPALGVAGVAGVSEKGGSWKERAKYSIIIFDESFEDIGPVEKPEEVQILDECLLVVPRWVFDKIRFDGEVFDGWDCYGADYCLAIKQLGLKAYVIPGACSHCNLRAKFQLWKFGDLLKYQKRLYLKHKRRHKIIYTWMGVISPRHLSEREILEFFGPLYHKLFPNYSAIIKKELSGCETVLDLACGYHSQIHTFGIPYSVGVELSGPFLQASKRLGIHNQYIHGDIRKTEFKPKSFDAVIALGAFGTLTKQEGKELLNKMELWAKKKIIITILNQNANRGMHGNNLLKGHEFVWSIRELSDIGFKVRGYGGWKGLKQEYHFLRNLVSNLTQKMVYYFPKQASGFFATKRTD